MYMYVCGLTGKQSSKWEFSLPVRTLLQTCVIPLASYPAYLLGEAASEEKYAICLIIIYCHWPSISMHYVQGMMLDSIIGGHDAIC